MASRIYVICDSYESGYGHGLQGDGLDLSKTPHGDPELGEAYQIGYEAGLEMFKFRQAAFDKWWAMEPVSEFEGVDAGHVERAFAAGRKAEREECAKTCHEIQMTRFAHDNSDEYHDGKAEGAKECWQAIRMRSNV